MNAESSVLRPECALQWKPLRLSAALRGLVDWLGRSRLRFAMVMATVLVTAYNVPFWSGSIEAVGGVSVDGVAFLVSLAVMLIAIHALLLLLVPGRRLAPMVAAALLVAASMVLYYEASLNVYFDSVMVRNVFETDAAEMRDVINPALIAYVLLLGIAPAAVVAQVRVQAGPLSRRLGVLAAATAGTVVLVGGLSVTFSTHMASYLREHKPLRYLVNPMNFVYGGVAYALGEEQGVRPFEQMGGRVQRVAAARGSKPLLVLVVLGETARAASFELGGYSRPTNPMLRRIEGLVYFDEVSSCGTSTAVSLPCMFSHLGREDFDLSLARSQSNLVDAVANGEVDVEWRENNSGCKHVCDRVRTVDFRVPPVASGCEGEHCFDDDMTRGLRERLTAEPNDTLVVMHQAGSHGPAYFERYPRAFEKFTPACRTKELGQCDDAEIVNAYDNSILYTDYVVARQIELLESMQDRFDSALVYVSDHGESLGENGLYLHAAPYFMAPAEQTHVPMMVWLSDGYRERAGVDVACLQARASQPASHDDLYGTVLGALGLQNDAYRRDGDLLAACRKAW